MQQREIDGVAYGVGDGSSEVAAALLVSGGHGGGVFFGGFVGGGPAEGGSFHGGSFPSMPISSNSANSLESKKTPPSSST